MLSLGIEATDRSTVRRLRLVNGFAYGISLLIAATLGLMVVVLTVTDGTLLTSGFAFMVIGIIAPWATPFFHKRSTQAGALYMIALLLAIVLASVVRHGQAQGIHLSFFAFLVVVPLMLGMRSAMLNAAAALAFFIIFVLSDLYAPAKGPDLVSRPQEAITAMRYVTISLFFMIICFSINYAFSVAERAERALQAEYERSENLLYNLLPVDIARRLKLEPGKTIADNLPKVAILFADIVDFTPRASRLPPEEVVGFLNSIFTRFDQLADEHGLEKIKTIGDAYMVAAGMPSPVGDPVHRVAQMALAMQRAAKAMSPDLPDGLQVRIGLHAGPAVAGVIGNKKLFYDVWGETVNTASRMESHGEAGRIQVTKPAYEELNDDYVFEERGSVDIKGVGTMPTWWLTGSRDELEAPHATEGM